MKNQSKQIRFKSEGNEPFLKDLRKEVQHYFITQKIKKTATAVLHLKTICLISSMVVLYTALLIGTFSDFQFLLLWALFGLGQALVAVNIGHDALHGSYFRSAFANKILGLLAYDALGLSSYIWKETHNKEHHLYTNIKGADPDIDKPGILRLSPHDPYYSIHRFQFLYVWFLYALVSLNWIYYADYLHFWKLHKTIPFQEKCTFFFFKALNLVLNPFLFLIFSHMSWKVIFGGLFLMHAAAGITVSIIFQLAHLVENVEFPLPDDEGTISAPWGTHEMKTTSNFATKNWWVTHVVGGLNFQIEHHLFPQISHVHYFNLSEIVRLTAKKHNLPYHEYPTTRAAICSHANYLRTLGKS